MTLQSSDEETKAIRERIVSIRRKIHKNTVNAVTARWNYEEGVCFLKDALLSFVIVLLLTYLRNSFFLFAAISFFLNPIYNFL